MSLILVKPYFEARCEAVGLDKHRDGFNEENVGSTRLDLSYHVLLGQFNGIKLIDIVGDEGISGSTLDRPGLQTALPRCWERDALRRCA